MREVITHSVEETIHVAQQWLLSLLDVRRETRSLQDRAVVIALSGNLGSGKTTFTQAIARELGIEEAVTSPTFVILKRYEITNQKYIKSNFKYLIHIDAYRLENYRELEAIGFIDLIKDQNNLIMIEWPEKVIEILPEFAETIKFTFVDETVRKVEFTA